MGIARRHNNAPDGGWTWNGLYGQPAFVRVAPAKQTTREAVE